MIYVIDELMGRGKTSAMINRMNRSGDNERFLFITPYLGEVTRILEACHSKEFVEPLDLGGKRNHIKTLIEKRCNIASTHYLFGLLDAEATDMLAAAGYTLIVDEAQAVTGGVTITKGDMDILTRTKVSISDEDGVSWEDDEYEGALSGYKEIVKKGNVYRYSDGCWVTMMPERLFRCFKDIYIMTYMFDDQIQRCYFDLKGMKYEHLYISGDSPETYDISETPCPLQKVDYTRLVKILDKPKLNAVGDDKNALSKGWYTKHYKDSEMDRLRKDIYNFYRNYAKTPAGQNMWTTFKGDGIRYDWKGQLSDSRFSTGFLACNARGTNRFRDRTALAYTVNRFPVPAQVNFLAKNGIQFSRDRFALSEMLQWVWRSAIRDGKEIFLYVPSRRMRTLFTDWLKEVSS